jgi:hypothetical protein
MKQKLLNVGLVVLVLTLSSLANAQGKSGGAGQGQRPTAGQQHNDESGQQQMDERRQEAEDRRAEAETKSREELSRAEHAPDEHAADAAAAAEQNVQGNETAAEMRARSDERKAIKEEYHGDREPGQEGVDPDDAGEDAADEQKEKAKKPWWKFWGD